MVWAIWLHRNEVVFEGKAVSSEGIIHEVESFVGAWFLHMRELEGREGMMGHPVGLVTYFPLCMAVHRFG